LQAEVQGIFNWEGAAPVQRLRQQLARQTRSYQVDQTIGSLAQLLDSSNVEMPDSGSMTETFPQELERDRIRRGAEDQHLELGPVVQVLGTVQRPEGELAQPLAEPDALLQDPSRQGLPAGTHIRVVLGPAVGAERRSQNPVVPRKAGVGRTPMGARSS
jgi:hypothetical protein